MAVLFVCFVYVALLLSLQLLFGNKGLTEIQSLTLNPKSSCHTLLSIGLLRVLYHTELRNTVLNNNHELDGLLTCLVFNLL